MPPIISQPNSVQEFATRVLFGTTLEEKLTPPPKELKLDAPHKKGIKTPDLPGRPAELSPTLNLHKNNKLANIGSIHTDDQRTRLLHAFANHELVAVELMALALLKFPDAPNAFRSGLLHTLQEEQQHTKWYLARLEQVGASFGQYQLSDMIWKHISHMDSPLDYVSRLSLTFEQANLDYALHYSKLLHEAGDEPSARILNKIYQDEISHVGYGLHWLRQFKQKAESDWDAWHRSLALPLNPVRAKGNLPNGFFNEDARRKAGFDDDFIEKLKLHQASRGRSPDLWFYNPDAESELSAKENNYQTPTRLEELAADLELVFHLAIPTADDLVLLRRQPRPAFLKNLSKHGLTLPENILLAESDLPTRKIRHFHPWAHTPSTQKIADSIGEITTAPPSPTQLHRKSLLPTWRSQLSEKLPLTPSIKASSLSELIEAQAQLNRDGYLDLVLKESLSSSGRGLHLITSETDLTDEKNASRPLKRVLHSLKNHPLLIEPWLEKTTEFSLHYQTNPHTPDSPLRLLGLTTQETSPTGTWLSSSASHKPAILFSTQETEQLYNQALPFEKTELRPFLEKIVTAHGYGLDPKQGPRPLSIDTFFYRDLKGMLHWNYLVEINPRYTMGRITLNLHQRLQKNLTLKMFKKDEAARLTNSPDHFLLADPNQAHQRVPTVLFS